MPSAQCERLGRVRHWLLLLPLSAGGVVSVDGRMHTAAPMAVAEVEVYEQAVPDQAGPPTHPLDWFVTASGPGPAEVRGTDPDSRRQCPQCQAAL